MKKLIVCLVGALAVGVAVTSPSVVLSIGAATSDATDITESGAVLNGSLTHGAGEYMAAFAVSTSSSFSQPVFDYSSPCNTTGKVLIIRMQNGGFISSGTSDTSFDFRSWTPCGVGSGLIPGTKYYYKIGIIQPDSGLCIYDMSCYTWGNSVSFVTRSAVLPSATTGNTSTVGPDSVVLNASVVAADGKADVTFEYGLTATLTDAKSISAGQVNPSSGYLSGISAPVLFSGSQKLTGLIESTTYYYRVVATSIYGTSRGEIKSFTTRPPVGISINSASEFTRTTGVSISVSWPVNAESMLVSNDGGFRTQQSFALAEELNWTLLSSGDERLPKTVYLKFVMTDGSRSSIYADDIILDTTAPVLTQASATTVNSSAGVSVAAARKNAVRLKVTTSDANSGIDHLEVKSSVGGIPALVSIMKTGKVTTSVILKTAKRSFLVRAIDRAGNPSTKWVKVVTKG